MRVRSARVLTKRSWIGLTSANTHLLGRCFADCDRIYANTILQIRYRECVHFQYVRFLLGRVPPPVSGIKVALQQYPNKQKVEP